MASASIPALHRLDYEAAARDQGAWKSFQAAALAAMDQDGAVIVENALTRESCDAIVAEMRPFLDATAMGNEAFTGAKTRRTGALAARSPSSHEALTHPVLKYLCDEILGAQCLTGGKVNLAYDAAAVAVAPLPNKKDDADRRPRFPWQLHLTQIIDIGPGERPQSVHRDRWAFLYDFNQGSEIEISTMWALTDFTEENGATRVVPGSHRWDERSLKSAIPMEETTFAAMPKGSVLIYTGSTFHGGGQNRTTERRVGLNVDYNLAFLRQEENQYLSAPPHVAKTFPKDLQRLLGYSLAGGGLGYFADVLSPSAALRGFDVTTPASTARSKL